MEAKERAREILKDVSAPCIMEGTAGIDPVDIVFDALEAHAAEAVEEALRPEPNDHWFTQFKRAEAAESELVKTRERAAGLEARLRQAEGVMYQALGNEDGLDGSEADKMREYLEAVGTPALDAARREARAQEADESRRTAREIIVTQCGGNPEWQRGVDTAKACLDGFFKGRAAELRRGE